MDEAHNDVIAVPSWLLDANVRALLRKAAVDESGVALYAPHAIPRRKPHLRGDDGWIRQVVPNSFPTLDSSSSVDCLFYICHGPAVTPYLAHGVVVDAAKAASATTSSSTTTSLECHNKGSSSTFACPVTVALGHDCQAGSHTFTSLVFTAAIRKTSIDTSAATSTSLETLVIACPQNSSNVDVEADCRAEAFRDAGLERKIGYPTPKTTTLARSDLLVLQVPQGTLLTCTISCRHRAHNTFTNNHNQQ